MELYQILHTLRALLILTMICMVGLLAGSSAVAAIRDDAMGAVMRIDTASGSHIPAELEIMAEIEEVLLQAEQAHQDNDAFTADTLFLRVYNKSLLLEKMQQQRTSRGTIDSAVPSASPLFINYSTKYSLMPEDPGSTEIYSDQFNETAASARLVGSPNYYTVRKGDSLRQIAAKLGVSRQQLTSLNNLGKKGTLTVGQQLKYNNRKIVPKTIKEGIVVNIPDKTLYYFQKGKLVRSFPVALGSPVKNEKFVWQTPVGKFRIVGKQKDPTWFIPPSIRTEMQEKQKIKGKEPALFIPPGPTNPLGKYAIKTSLPGILIHSTIKPSSIYSFSSHGCIRMYPAHIEEFFKELKVNTPGEIIYQPAKIAITEEGRVFLEVHKDIYGKTAELAEEVKNLIAKARVSGKVDWKKVDHIVKAKAGIALDVSL